MQAVNRVVITGCGALTASGETLDSHWEALLSGQSSISEIQQWDLSSWNHRLGGEIKAYNPGAWLPDRKLAKVISRQDVMGIYAASQAVMDSQCIPYRDSLSDPTHFNDQTAVFVGSPGNKYLQQYDFLPLVSHSNGDMKAFAEGLFSEVHPMWLLRILPNNVLAYTGITYGFKGVNHNVTNHAIGGAQAVIEAYHAIMSGQAERAIVVAYDLGIEPQALFYYERLGVISPTHLKPFDVTHNGTILAEGAAALFLESEASAKARGAHIYAAFTGGLSRTEAQGLFSIDASGAPLQGLMDDLLHSTHVKPEDIGFVVAHGNGNPPSDCSEAAAILQSLGADVPVTAFKWAMGHTLCASGVLDLVLAARALQEAVIPGIPNLDSPAVPLSLSATHRSLPENKSHALVLNRGFSSMNAAMLLSR